MGFRHRIFIRLKVGWKKECDNNKFILPTVLIHSKSNECKTTCKTQQPDWHSVNTIAGLLGFCLYNRRGIWA